MKRLTSRLNRRNMQNRKTKQTDNRRRGSALLIVIVLLASLTTLGVLAYGLSSQQSHTAEYFSEAAKVREKADVDRDAIMDFVLRQIIIGPRNGESQSVLYGGRHSLMASMFGRDAQPYNGSGVQLRWNTGTNQPEVDMDLNGTADNAHLLDLNDSPAAQGSVPNLNAAGTYYPDPDADYTSPDHNSPFLFHMVDVQDGAGESTVIIPSFQRPQLLRNVATPANWYSDAATVTKVFRPHEDHLAVALKADGTSEETTIPRYVVTSGDATSLGLTGPFPFPSNGGSDATGRLGVWTGNGSNYSVLDADVDNDGQLDSVYLDLGIPVQFTTVGDEPYVPIVSIKIESADELASVNAHGNAFGSTADVSKSNHGLTPFEINSTWVLNATPPASGDPELDPHEYFFGVEPTNAIELANQELQFLLKGRPKYGASALDILGYLTGRDGEKPLLEASQVPWAGTTFDSDPIIADDNNNRNLGGTYSGDGVVFPAFVQFPAFQHPVDYKAAGTYVQAASNGKIRDLAAVGKHQFPRYDQYWANADGRYYLASSGTHSNALMTSVTTGLLLDDPAELWLEDGDDSLRENDHIYSARENAALQLSTADIASNNTQSRLFKLAPINFKQSSREEEIRRSFTTHSWDVQSFGRTTHSTNMPALAANRMWEFNADSDSDGHLEFPPTYVDTTGTNPLEPFRSAVRQLFSVEEPVKTISTVTFQSVLQRRLSINHLVDVAPNGRLRHRPLTPHPTGLASAVLPVTGPTDPASVTTAAEQESLARRDRQLMCRDIYVLLWTLGNPADTDLTGNPAAYSAAEAQRMAQFAVNWVDALDPDDVITVFEYDTDLSDGWQLDDNPFTDTGTGDAVVATDDSDRELVYGLEEQKLALSEVVAIFAKEQMTDFAGTEYDDTSHHDFLNIELQNVSTEAITFDDKEAYQIAIMPADVSSATYLEERRLTLRNGAGTVASGTGSHYSIGTAGDVSNLALTGDPDYAINTPLIRFQVNPTEGEMPDNGMQLIAPATALKLGNAAGHMNLFTTSSSTYRVLVPPASTAAGETEVTTPDVGVGEPQGVDLLHLIEVQKDLITPGAVNVRVELRRRLNPTRATPSTSGTPAVVSRTESDDNPWVVIDWMEAPLQVFEPSANSGAQIRTALNNTGSTERYQPLYGVQVQTVAPIKTNGTTITSPPAAGFPTNTIGGDNNNNGSSPASYALWQPHFNRDFYSVTELLSLPLFGPRAEDADATTMFAEYTEDTSGVLSRHLGDQPLNSKFDETVTAGEIVLNSTNNIHPSSSTAGNRWYRLLNFVEHPSMMHRHENDPGYVIDIGAIGSTDPGIYRVPGRVQLNTLRHPSMLAAIVDDTDIIPSYNPLAAFPQLLDADGRDWWAEFLEARDGIDPISGLTLPGVPADPASAYPEAGPFRSLGTSQYGANSIEHTILRSLPADSAAGDKRRLFEIGTALEHTGAASDHTVRNRILSKLINNTTTRSHVFFVTVQVDFFEAAPVDTTVSAENVTVYRVGQKRADSPGWRNFFVVDRSQALEILQTTDLPDVNATYNNLSFGSDFDYNELILHRQELN